jgi:hypothetical protein
MAVSYKSSEALERGGEMARDGASKVKLPKRSNKSEYMIKRL